MVTVGSVEFLRTSQLCQLVSQGFSLCYQLWAEKKNALGKKRPSILPVSLVKHFLLATIPPLGTESTDILFMSLEQRLEKSLSVSLGTEGRDL